MAALAGAEEEVDDVGKAKIEVWQEEELCGEGDVDDTKKGFLTEMKKRRLMEGSPGLHDPFRG